MKRFGILLTHARHYSSSSMRGSGGVALSYTEYVESAQTQQTLPPLFMTHGLLGSKQNWNSIAKAVAKSSGRRVITFDARNHGDSPQHPTHSYEAMADDILHMAEDLGIERFSLLGHSMGGRTVMTFGLTHPSKMEKLIVVDVSPLSMSGAFGQMKSFLEALHLMTLDPSLTLSEGRKTADQELMAVTDDASLRAFLLTNLARNEEGFYWKPNLPVLLATLPNLRHFPLDLLSTPPNTDFPVVFIRGGNSGYIPISDFPGIKAVFPQAEFETIEGAGHWPQAESPNQFIPVLLSFLAK